jgi:hypothetical protein
MNGCGNPVNVHLPSTFWYANPVDKLFMLSVSMSTSVTQPKSPAADATTRLIGSTVKWLALEDKFGVESEALTRWIVVQT